MAKGWKIILWTAGVLLLLGIALGAVSLLTGGSPGRIMETTGVLDYSKFISTEQLALLRSLLP